MRSKHKYIHILYYLLVFGFVFNLSPSYTNARCPAEDPDCYEGGGGGGEDDPPPPPKTPQCESGWYVCGGSYCCKGGGCPTGLCGACPGGTWEAIPNSSSSVCPTTGENCPGQCYSGGGGSTGDPPPPGAAPITGYVWEDRNSDGIAGTDDTFWGTLDEASCTSHVSSNLKIVETESGKKSNFKCTSVSRRNYPIFVVDNPVVALALARVTPSFRFTPPSSVTCDQVTWKYTFCRNGSCSEKKTGSGSGCVANTVLPSAAFPNSIVWKIDSYTPPITRTISGKIYEINDPSTCVQTAILPFSGLNAKAYNGITQLGDPAGVAVEQSTGNFSITGLQTSDVFDTLSINGTLANQDKAFRLSCISSAQVECDVGSGAIAVGCSLPGYNPPASLLNSDISVNLGFQAYSGEKWFSSLDGDIYSSDISTFVGTKPLGGFASNIINTQNDSTAGGYGFAGFNIDTQSVGSSVSEKGGAVESLNATGEYNFKDQWFDRFSFTIPQSAVEEIPAGNIFTEGKVYVMTPAQFNEVILGGSYSFEDGNTNGPAASIVYVEGGGTIEFKNAFISENTDKLLLLVTTSSIEVYPTVGLEEDALLDVNGATQIDLAILTSKEITTLSKYVKESLVYDVPVMFNGALMSRSELGFFRNLGPDGNSSYPAETVRFFPYLLNLIKKYEIESQFNGSYTGLTSFDVQFNYGN